MQTELAQRPVPPATVTIAPQFHHQDVILGGAAQDALFLRQDDEARRLGLKGSVTSCRTLAVILKVRTTGFRRLAKVEVGITTHERH
jgi:hypothetical protein